MTYVLRWSDREFLSAMTLARKGPTFWWAKTADKALRFTSRELADALCGMVNSYDATKGHAVMEVPE